MYEELGETGLLLIWLCNFIQIILLFQIWQWFYKVLSKHEDLHLAANSVTVLQKYPHKNLYDFCDDNNNISSKSEGCGLNSKCNIKQHNLWLIYKTSLIKHCEHGAWNATSREGTPTIKGIEVELMPSTIDTQWENAMSWLLFSVAIV